MAERTPPERNRHIDLLRALAISAVVVGHWLAIAITDRDGELEGRNTLQVLTWAYPLTWLFQVMPVFFLVGGYANAASLTSHRRRGGRATAWLLQRTDRLLRPTTAFLLVLVSGALLARIGGVDLDLVGRAVWLAQIPLWFLLAYVAIVALGPVMYAVHQRIGLLVPVILVGAVGVIDFAHLVLDLPYVGYANYLLAWLAIHQMGFAWQDRRLAKRPGLASALAVGGMVGLLLLTVAGPYPVSMITLPGADLQNTAPPTLALLALAATQTGLALLTEKRGNRWLTRIRPWTIVVTINAVILTMYLWHMTAALIGIVALYGTELMPQQPVGSPGWLLLRIPWLAFLALVLGVLVAGFGRIEQRAAARTALVSAGRMTVRGALTAVGLLAVLTGLLGIAVTPPHEYGPVGVPVAGLVGYLAGAAVLRLARRGVSSS